MPADPVRLSKFLSLVLRHEPQRAGLVLDEVGWVAVDELLAGCARAGVPVTREQLTDMVAESDKQRFAFSPDGGRIRANQGHSVEVKLDYAPQTPPELLFHGTATRFLDSIRDRGLVRGDRHHVHLSADLETARKVGQRHGQPIVLTVRAREMYRAGHVFLRSANGVWLAEAVPVDWLEFPSERI